MIISFLGGLALFLYGQFLLERSIQRTSRVYLRAFIKLLTKHRVTAILVGAFLTICMQSSTMSALTIIDLINLGILRLGQALVIVFGTSVGTTVIVQAISFNPAVFALWFIVIGFLISKISKYARGELLMGFGFMFYGIYLMGSGVALFKETPFGNSFLLGTCTNPVQNFIGAFILTVISQSSLASMAIGITLVRNAGLGLNCAIPIIFGAHIGAGILPLIYSWKVSRTVIGRQLSIANLIYRIAGVLIFIPLIGLLAKVSLGITQWLGAGSVRQLANAHTIFTLTTVLLFTPFAFLYTRIAKKAKSSMKKSEDNQSVKENINVIEQEEISLAERTYELLKDSMRLWEENKLSRIDKVAEECFSMRSYEENIYKNVIGREQDLSGNKHYIKILENVSNMGKVNNVISSGLINLIRKMVMQGLNFSIEGLNEVLTIHKRIIDEFGEIIKFLKEEKITCDLQKYDKEIELLISLSFASHVGRMNKGFRETKETISLHTDAINLLEQIHWLIKKVIGKG